MDNMETAVIEAGKRKMRNPWLFVMGCMCLLLALACEIYGWLVGREAIAGPELRTSGILAILGTAFVNLSRANIKRRWLHYTFSIIGTLLAGLLVLSIVNTFKPFPGHAFDELFGFYFLPYFFFAMASLIVTELHAPQIEKKALARKEKVKAAAIVISLIAGATAFWFGSTRLLYWLFTWG